jgi:hypothetical protein
MASECAALDLLASSGELDCIMVNSTLESEIEANGKS